MPISGFDAGWIGIHVISDFRPIYILELRHEDGREASWFLDHQMHHIGGGLPQAAALAGAPLKDGIVAVFRRSMARVDHIALGQVIEKIPEENVACLCDRTIFDLLELTWDTVFGATRTLDLDDAASSDILPRFGLSMACLSSALGGSVPQAYLERYRTQVFARPSPFGEGMAVADIGLLIQDRLTVYRFVDASRSRIFYLFTDGYHDRTCAIYIPDCALYCTLGSAPGFRHVSFLFLLHIVRHSQRIARYLSTPAERKKNVSFVSDYPTLHLGHVIWNELSGLVEILQAVEEEQLPDIYVLNADNGSEPFGRIDVILPELSGRVVRPSFIWADAATRVYEEELFFTRYMTRYVRQDLGRRLLHQLEHDPRLVDERRLAKALDNRALVLLGLRVGNRTIPDIGAFYIDVIQHLVKRLGQVAIVVEGHDARVAGDPSTSFHSFGPANQEEHLLDELRIIFLLRKHFHNNRHVAIVGAIGTSIATSLFWTSRCRFFIAPWGASLAKYRWICNKPGFVMTNRFNIGHPIGDLLIYNSPDFVERPTPMEIIALEDIRDAPGPSGFYANFIPSFPAVAAGIDRMIEYTRS